jgi:ferredoxin-NADP reductase
VPEKKLVMSATGPHGDFIFPEDPSKKLFFLASGIGIASFMSYLRQLAERRERRDIVLLYSATSPLDFIFREEIDSYKDRIGLVVEYVPLDFVELGGKWQGISGPLTAKLVQDHVAKFEARCWYVAGPQFTVEQYKKIAETLHVPASSLKMQQYPGF